jgi:hypothetical protein
MTDLAGSGTDASRSYRRVQIASALFTVYLVWGSTYLAAVPTWALVLVAVASMAWALGSWLSARLDLPRDPLVVVVYEMLTRGSIVAGTCFVVGVALVVGSEVPKGGRSRAAAADMREEVAA